MNQLHSFSRTRQWLTLLFVLLSYSGITAAANITVTASRNPVSLDDSFHIVYEADSSVDGDPDFSPIYQYFDVLSSSQSTNMRSINGNWSLQKSWDLAVIAKKVGTVTLPPIKFGKDISPAIKITVSNSSSANPLSKNGAATIPASIFLESNISTKTGWVDQQLIYTVRLLRTVSITGASMTTPETSDKDAIIEQIGEDSYQTTRNGIRYEVYERRYAIFPQHSGKLSIDPVTFEGRINSTQPQSIFDRFRMSGQLKRLRSPGIEVNIKPVPTSQNPANWLPAKHVRLEDAWSVDVQKLKTGEPVTRTITLVAEGLSAVQLPDLKFDDIDGLKLYPDKASTDDQVDNNNGITGTKQYRIAIIPTRPGEFTLPAIKVKWWNTDKQKSETAVLPGTRLSVTGAAASAPVATPPPVVQPGTQNTSTAVPAGESVNTSMAASSDMRYWQWATLAFALAWLITLALYFSKSRGAATTENANSPSLKQLRNDVIKAANNGDIRATQDALVRWARIFYEDGTITNLAHIAQRSSDTLADQCRLISQSLYSDNDNNRWQPEALIDAIRNERPPQSTHSNSSKLKPLYKA